MLIFEMLFQCSTPSPKVDELVVQLFKESTDKCTKKQFLSMISLNYTKQQLRDIFPGITIYEIDQARIHAKTCGKGITLFIINSVCIY